MAKHRVADVNLETWLQVTGYYDDKKRKTVLDACEELHTYEEEASKELAALDGERKRKVAKYKKTRAQMLSSTRDVVAAKAPIDVASSLGKRQSPPPPSSERPPKAPKATKSRESKGSSGASHPPILISSSPAGSPSSPPLKMNAPIRPKSPAKGKSKPAKLAVATRAPVAYMTPTPYNGEVEGATKEEDQGLRGTGFDRGGKK